MNRPACQALTLAVSFLLFGGAVWIRSVLLSQFTLLAVPLRPEWCLLPGSSAFPDLPSLRHPSSLQQLGIRYTITTLSKLPAPARLTEEQFKEKVGWVSGQFLGGLARCLSPCGQPGRCGVP
jgi:hypothetical protein